MISLVFYHMEKWTSSKTVENLLVLEGGVIAECDSAMLQKLGDG